MPISVDDSVDPITAAIEESLEAAMDPPEDTPGGETPPETTTPDPAATPGAGEPAQADPAKPAAKPAEGDDVEKFLETEGFKPRTPDGTRENRLPHSRVVKMIKKAIEKTRKELEDASAPTKAELEEAKKKLENMDRVEKLIAEDADRYMSMLAAINPAYKRFIQSGQPIPAAGTPGAPAAALPAEADDPMPGPDLRFSDGSMGYGPEGLSNLLNWQARQVERRVTTRLEKAYNERFGPIENEWKTQKTMQSQLPAVRAKIDRAKRRWGKLFEDDYALDSKSEVLAFMRAHPDVPFEEAVEEVLLPKLRTAEDSMRQKILKELQERPAAAAGAPPAASAAGDQGTPGGTSRQDAITKAINDSIAKAGLK